MAYTEFDTEEDDPEDDYDDFDDFPGICRPPTDDEIISRLRVDSMSHEPDIIIESRGKKRRPNSRSRVAANSRPDTAPAWTAVQSVADIEMLNDLKDSNDKMLSAAAKLELAMADTIEMPNGAQVMLVNRPSSGVSAINQTQSLRGMSFLPAMSQGAEGVTRNSSGSADRMMASLPAVSALGAALSPLEGSVGERGVMLQSRSQQDNLVFVLREQRAVQARLNRDRSEQERKKLNRPASRTPAQGSPAKQKQVQGQRPAGFGSSEPRGREIRDMQRKAKEGPAPGSYTPLNASDRISGGRFSTANPKSDVEWKMHRAKQTPGPADYGAPNRPGEGLGDLKTGRFNLSHPKGMIEQAVHDHKETPGVGSYDRRRSFKTAGGRFNPSRSKTDLEWQIQRAKQLPGPGDYDEYHEKKQGGAFNLAVSKNWVEQEIYNHKIGPGPALMKRPSIKVSGGRFNLSNPKSDVEWQMLRAKQIPGPGDTQPDKGFTTLDAHGGAFNTAVSKTMIEQEIYDHRQTPGVGTYHPQNDSMHPKAISGGRFNLSKPKSDIDWQMMRAKQQPGPADYQPRKSVTHGGHFNASRSKNFIEQEIYDKKDIPGAGSTQPEYGFTSLKQVGGRFSSANPKSEIEQQISRAKQLPGPAQYTRKKSMTSGGHFNHANSKTYIEQAIYDKQDIPASTDLQPEYGFSSLKKAGGHFSTAVTKSDIEEQIYRAKALPGVGAYEVKSTPRISTKNAMYNQQMTRALEKQPSPNLKLRGKPPAAVVNIKNHAKNRRASKRLAAFNASMGRKDSSAQPSQLKQQQLKPKKYTHPAPRSKANCSHVNSTKQASKMKMSKADARKIARQFERRMVHA